MDIVLGIRVKDAVLLASSKAFTRGISILKDSDDKTRALSDHCLMSFTGESGDTTQFAEYIQANMQLHSIRETNNNTNVQETSTTSDEGSIGTFELSPSATASFVRNELAKSLRSRKPFQVNVLIGGYDTKANQPLLYQIDYLGTKVELPYAAHGYAGFYTFSLLDHHYRPDMDVTEGLKLLQKCLDELVKRMPMDFKGVYVKIVDKDGIRLVEDF